MRSIFAYVIVQNKEEEWYALITFYVKSCYVR